MYTHITSYIDIVQQPFQNIDADELLSYHQCREKGDPLVDGPVRGDDPPGGDDPDGHDDHHGAGRAGIDESDAKLMRQWLAAALRPYDYISFPAGDVGGEQELMFVQVLAVNPKNVVAKAFDPQAREAEQFLFNIDVQVVEAWAPKFADPTIEGANYDVFVFADPTHIDVLGLLGTDPNSRKSMLRWQASQSDVDGCTLLSHAVPLKPMMSLNDSKAPALALLDELEHLGYTKQDRTLHHHAHSALEYDNRKAFSRRMYYKCLLCHRELLLHGAGDFRSDRPAAWFELLLRTKRLVPADWNAKRCKMELVKHGDLGALASLQQEVRAPVPRPRPADRAASDDSEVAGDLPPVVDGAAGGEGPEGADGDDGAGPEGGSEASEDEVAGDGADLGAGPDDGDAEPLGLDGEPIPEEIEGCRVRFIPGRDDERWRYHDRIEAFCCVHSGCQKSRSLHLMVDRLGPTAAYIFIGAWAAKAEDMPAERHKAYRPTLADMREYSDAH